MEIEQSFDAIANLSLVQPQMLRHNNISVYYVLIVLTNFKSKKSILFDFEFAILTPRFSQLI